MVEAVPVELDSQSVEDYGVVVDNLYLWSISCQPGPCQAPFTSEEVRVKERRRRVQVEFLSRYRNGGRQASKVSIIAGQRGIGEGYDSKVACSGGGQSRIVHRGSSDGDGSDGDECD